MIVLGSNEFKTLSTTPDMVYSKNLTSSDIEKRLEVLKRQLYGKGAEVKSFRQGPASQRGERGSPVETNYLQKDLLKIFLLASSAITVQILLKLAIPRYDWTIWATKLF